MSKKQKKRGFAVIWSLVGLMIIGLGTTAVVVVTRSSALHQAQSAAQSQRETFTTFQMEVVAHGIDPSKVINPLAAIGEAGPNTAANFRTSEGNAYEQKGAAGVLALGMTAADNTGERAGGLGFEIVAGGTAAEATNRLASPVFVVSLPLTAASFPASAWVTLPTSNPPETIYRYTTDGSEPDKNSPIWSAASADSSITPATFPATLRIAAFHPLPFHAPSPVATLSSITFQLPGLVFGRSKGGSSTTFSYADITSSPNGIVLSPAASLGNLPFQIRYTLNEATPTTASTAYSAGFVIGESSWSASLPLKAAIFPNVSTARAALYITSGANIWTLAPVITPLAKPTIVTANTAILREGSDISISPAQTGGILRTEVNMAPSSTSSSSITIKIK
jgi:hypothetical protein